MLNTCKHCGKSGFLDYDRPEGCLRPFTYSPCVGDWACGLQTNEGPAMFYIKSDKGYWLPGAYGYTQDKQKAGVFSLADMERLALDGCTLEAANGH